jgi:nuclear transport factor 2 (NTF2) superfamily protein
MSDDTAEAKDSKALVPTTNATEPEQTTARIDRLEAELARYRAVLEEIRDQKFEQSNSQRLIDELWHFVRWSKATARSALEQPREKSKK